jgi:hypothetical protein
VFGIVIVMTIQNVFRLKMHQNKVFSFFKNYFWYQHIKTIRKYKKIILNKKIILFLNLRNCNFNCISKHTHRKIRLYQLNKKGQEFSSTVYSSAHLHDKVEAPPLVGWIWFHFQIGNKTITYIIISLQLLQLRAARPKNSGRSSSHVS